MDAITTFPRMSEWEKAKAKLDAAGLSYRLISPHPGYSRVGVPAIVLRMKEVIIKMTPQEQMRIKIIVIDKDRDDALEFLKLLLEKTETASNSGMCSSLDQHKG
jgi:hypothetical protein